MARKSNKPPTRAQLRFKASAYLYMPPSLILNVVPNCGGTKYFIHYFEPTLDNKHRYYTELVTAQELEKQKL